MNEYFKHWNKVKITFRRIEEWIPFILDTSLKGGLIYKITKNLFLFLQTSNGRTKHLSSSFDVGHVLFTKYLIWTECAKEKNHHKTVICCFFSAPRSDEHAVYYKSPYKFTVLSPLSALLEAFLLVKVSSPFNELKGLFSSLISLCWVNWL